MKRRIDNLTHYTEVKVVPLFINMDKNLETTMYKGAKFNDKDDPSLFVHYISCDKTQLLHDLLSYKYDIDMQELDKLKVEELVKFLRKGLIIYYLNIQLEIIMKLIYEVQEGECI